MTWKRVRDGDLGRVVTGKTPETAVKENYGGSIMFVTPSDNMEEKYIQSELKYEKMNEGITYAEGDPYIKSSMENCSRNPMNVVRFKYFNEEQQARIYKAINDCLMGYGATSFRAKNGGSYIMPYFVDEE